jgi:FixJ family two-component response regulator
MGVCEAQLLAAPLHENVSRCRGVLMTTLSSKKSVFVVDDEPKVCEAICSTLEKSGIKVTAFNSGPECIEQLRLHKCDLLITDVKMPQMDGVELLTNARIIAPWLPVLMITGYGDVPMAVKAVRAGAVDFIEKPLRKGDFVRRIKLLLKESERLDPRVGTPLTKSEARVLQLIVNGKSNKEVAELLHRSVRTIEVHRSHLMRKLGAENLIDLLKRAAAMGLIELPTEHDQRETG